MKQYKSRVDVECPECGTPFRVQLDNFTSGNTRSCGCLRWRVTHGHSEHERSSRTYHSWDSMWQRVTNPKASKYKYYGGRGITIHPEWAKFENFLRDMGTRPANTSLDRIDNNEGYEMINCRWATRKQQAYNRS